MPKYEVSYSGYWRHVVEVEAEDEEYAQESAYDQLRSLPAGDLDRFSFEDSFIDEVG